MQDRFTQQDGPSKREARQKIMTAQIAAGRIRFAVLPKLHRFAMSTSQGPHQPYSIRILP